MVKQFLSRIAQITQDSVQLPNQIDPSNKGFVSDKIQSVLQIAFGALGAIAVLIIVIAALQYVISAGDPQKVGKAKDAIIYAIVGLIVAIAAFSIVTFVLGGIFS